MLINLPESRYLPSYDAAIHELHLAEEGYEIAQDKGFGGKWPYADNLERFRAARERLHLAQDNMHSARMREYQKKEPVWK